MTDSREEYRQAERDSYRDWTGPQCLPDGPVIRTAAERWADQVTYEVLALESEGWWGE